jgi:hypothetical protein
VNGDHVASVAHLLHVMRVLDHVRYLFYVINGALPFTAQRQRCSREERSDGVSQGRVE